LIPFIIRYGGSLARLLTDFLDWVLPIPDLRRTIATPAALPAPAAAATGPP
jgi:hypothetical protein